MGLIERIADRPIVVALAGPNGAGKSTFYDAHLANSGLHFVNADLLSLTLGLDPYAAAAMADRFRRDLVAQTQSFIFETVFSDPVGDKLEFLNAAENAGYGVVLIFIGLAGPQLSDRRVAMRAAAGGHDVPSQKLIERFPRILSNLRRALAQLPNIFVYDHSDLDRGYRLIATVEDRQAVELIEPAPEWFRSVLS